LTHIEGYQNKAPQRATNTADMLFLGCATHDHFKETIQEYKQADVFAGIILGTDSTPLEFQKTHVLVSYLETMPL
jgi:hypothetical protein